MPKYPSVDNPQFNKLLYKFPITPIYIPTLYIRQNTHTRAKGDTFSIYKITHDMCDLPSQSSIKQQLQSLSKEILTEELFDMIEESSTAISTTPIYYIPKTFNTKNSCKAYIENYILTTLEQVSSYHYHLSDNYYAEDKLDMLAYKINLIPKEYSLAKILKGIELVGGIMKIDSSEYEDNIIINSTYMCTAGDSSLQLEIGAKIP